MLIMKFNLFIIYIAIILSNLYIIPDFTISYLIIASLLSLTSVGWCVQLPNIKPPK